MSLSRWVSIVVRMVVLSALSLSVHAQSWDTQSPAPPFNCMIDAVTFADSLSGWAVGGPNGLLIHTADGGLNWTFQHTGTAYELTSVAFVDTGTGWIVGWHGTILQTTNARKFYFVTTVRP